MNTMFCCRIKAKTKTCNEMRMLSCVRNVTEVLSDRKSSLFSLLEGNRTTQLPEYVNISWLGHTHTQTHAHTNTHTHTHTRDSQLQHVFPQPPFCTQFPQFNYLPRPLILLRFCRPLIRHLLYISHPTITDITLSRITPEPPYCHPDYALATRKTTKKVKKLKNCGSVIPYGLFQAKGEMCAMFGSDLFRNVHLYKVQTHTHTHRQTNIQVYI
jgi:hypothetical protein